jgi:hypothetical protein
MKIKNRVLGVALFAIASVNAQIPTDGLVGYWPFNGNANDESGNSNHGIVTGAILTTDRYGNRNSAYFFDGSGDVITVNDDESIDITSAITIAAWRNLSLHTLGRIVRKVNTWGTSNGGYILSAADNYMNAELQINPSGGVNIIRIDSVFPYSTWEFVAMSYDGAKVSLYYNGQLIHQEEVTGLIRDNSENLLIGSSTGVEYFAGSIDDVRIYNRALSQNEIESLFTENSCFMTIYDTVHVQVNDTVKISVADTLIVDVLISGVQPPDDINTMKIYPNPAKDYLIINTGNYAEMTDYAIKIVNQLGVTVFETAVNQSEFEINLATWTGKGTYVLRIYDPDNQVVATKKIVLQ